ncbi:MAG TPA: IS110 family transposase [Ktedonobacterales bacterium]|nr:IS110 family transposase [Ktedonobacterales bacterium]
MQLVHERCAGLDVHKRTVVACVLITQPEGTCQRAVRTFSTMTADLLALGDWLDALRISVVARESTGVYWRPVFNLLEEGRTLILVNPQHIKAVPGRKTAVKDRAWLADLLRHGLLTPSFIPPQPIREVRELTRYRKRLVEERAREVGRVQKVLEGANMKLASVATEVLGKSGRAMLEALIRGEQDPAVLAERARGRLRAKRPQLQGALQGRLVAQHRTVLKHLLGHIDLLEQSIAELEAEIEHSLAPFGQAVALAQTLPGIAATAASAIVADIGVDMSRFPSARHLASWAGVCPGNKQSGGKRLSGQTTKGNPYLRAVLAEVAWAISRTKDKYLAAQFHRIARRRGQQKAVMAVAHSVLVILYHMLRESRPYTDLGPDYFERLEASQSERYHVRRLERLGYTVTLTPAPAA